MVRVNGLVTVFIRKERAEATARAFAASGKRKAEAVMCERLEEDRSRSVGWAVRYREPLGGYQFA